MEAPHPLLVCLHGFLGQGSDWLDVIPSNFRTLHPEFFGTHGVPQPFDFEGLANWVNSLAKRHPGPRILVGYSFGGRVALHALVSNPDFWDGAVIIAAHPGLTDEEERRKRIEADEKWARRFEGDEWDGLLSDWNSQPVLRGSSNLGRYEGDFSRPLLAAAFRGCSLGRQKDLRPFLQQTKIPILWLVGDRDSKFLSLGKEIASLNSKISLAILPHASHRAPWDQLGPFQEVLLRWLETL